MEREVTKRAIIYGLAALLLVSALTVMFLTAEYRPKLPPSDPPVPALQTAFLSTFSSLEALDNYINSKVGTQAYYPFYGRAALWLVNTPLLSTTDRANFFGSQAILKANTETFDYSSTNVQVEGVDEADIVKTDGEYLYILSGASVFIVRAYPPEDAEVLHEMSFEHMYPLELYVNGDVLVVLGSASLKSNRLYSYYGSYVNEIKTIVEVFDISDRRHPTLLRNITTTGGYFSSRMIDDFVYFIASAPAWMNNNRTVLPTISSNDKSKDIEATEVHYSNASDSSFDFTTIFAVNVKNTTEAPTYLTLLLGGACNIYASQANMYLTFPNTMSGTSIYRVRLQTGNLTCEANGSVDGRELNQFSMDEHNDYFRIITMSWRNGTSQTNLYVLDKNLTVTGKLENLGLNEYLHSSRFMDERCYLVTFKKTDPLFVINLTDPYNPAVLGELKIPGYSDYLHPYDETHIIGVGKETTEASQGDWAWYQGIKLSLFDVSNVSNPTQIDVFIIGDRGSDSPVLTDHKAFLFDRERELLVVPVLVKEIDRTQYPTDVPPDAYGTPVWQGAYVLRITKEGFTLRGRITHGAGSGVPENEYWVMRTLYIEDVLYTVSQMKLKLNDIDTLEKLGEVIFP